jgi:hypothetical protein
VTCIGPRHGDGRHLTEITVRSVKTCGEVINSPPTRNHRHLHAWEHCRCLDQATSIGGTRRRVVVEDRHDLEPEGMRYAQGHKLNSLALTDTFVVRVWSPLVEYFFEVNQDPIHLFELL